MRRNVTLYFYYYYLLLYINRQINIDILKEWDLVLMGINNLYSVGFSNRVVVVQEKLRRLDALRRNHLETALKEKLFDYCKRDPVVECIESIFEIRSDIKNGKAIVVDSTFLNGELYRNNTSFHRKTISAALKRLGYTSSFLVKNPKTRINHTFRYSPSKINKPDALALAKFTFEI